MTTTGSYVDIKRGDAPVEAARLRAQAAVIWEREREVLTQHGLLRSGLMLDLGCGPGFVLRQLRLHAPDATVVGLDREMAHLSLARAAGPVTRGAANVLPFGDRRFDFVLMRLVLRHVVDVGAVLREVARILRPGARVCVVDVDDETFLLDEPPADWPRLHAALMRTAERLGGDPRVGRTLHRRLREAGLGDVRVTPLPVSTGQLSARDFVELLLAPGARPIDEAILSRDASAAAWASLRAWAGRPHAWACCLGIVASGEAPA